MCSLRFDFEIHLSSLNYELRSIVCGLQNVKYELYNITSEL